MISCLALTGFSRKKLFTNPADQAPDAEVSEPTATTDAGDSTPADGEAVTYAFGEGSAISFVG